MPFILSDNERGTLHAYLKSPDVPDQIQGTDRKLYP